LSNGFALNPTKKQGTNLITYKKHEPKPTQKSKKPSAFLFGVEALVMFKVD
jgi:hypothetical protein